MTSPVTLHVGAADDDGGLSVASLVDSFKTFDRFTGGEVVLSMDQITNGFSLDLAPDPSSLAKRDVHLGDTCQIKIEGDEVIDGYVDEVTEEDDGERLSLSALGRSKTGDLADCSCYLGEGIPARWRKTDIRKIVGDIVEAFDENLEVIVQGDTGEKVARFAADTGELAADVIQRAAALRGMVAYSVGGTLVLSRAGSQEVTTQLEAGFNCKRIERTESVVERFRLYRFSGQTRASDEISGLRAGQLRGVVNDPGVARYRPLDLRVDGHTNEDMGKLAIRERNRRAGAGEAIRAYPDSPVMADDGRKAWRPNTLVPVKAPNLGIDAKMLLTRVAYRFSGSNLETELELTWPEAYSEADFPVRGRGEVWR